MGALRQFSRGNACGGDNDKDHVLSEVKCYFESTPSLAEAETPMLAEGSPLDVSLADQVGTCAQREGDPQAASPFWHVTSRRLSTSDATAVPCAQPAGC